jgi:hypothetical protein
MSNSSKINLINIIIKYKANKLKEFLNSISSNKLSSYLNLIEDAYNDCLNKIKVYYSDIPRNNKNIEILGDIIGFLNDKFNNINIKNYESEINLLNQLIDLSEKDKNEYLEKLKLYTTATRFTLQDFCNKIGYDLAIYLYVLTNKSLDINFKEILKLLIKYLSQKYTNSISFNTDFFSKKNNKSSSSNNLSLNKSSSNKSSSLSPFSIEDSDDSKEKKEEKKKRNKKRKVIRIIKMTKSSNTLKNNIKLSRIVINANVIYKKSLIKEIKLIEKKIPKISIESSAISRTYKSSVPFTQFLLPQTQLLLQKFNLNPYKYLFENLKFNYNLFLKMKENIYKLSTNVHNYSLQRYIINHSNTVKDIYNISNLYMILLLIQSKKSELPKTLEKKLISPIKFNTHILKFVYNNVKKLYKK